MYRKSHTPHEPPFVRSDPDGGEIKNPNQITVKQHVIPQRHLEEWVGADGRLTVRSKESERVIRPIPFDAFRFERLWDQPMEAGVLKTTEDQFQFVVTEYRSSGQIANHRWLTEYFVLLAARAHCVTKQRPEGSLFVDIHTDTEDEATSQDKMPIQDRLEREELEHINEPVRIISGYGDGQHISRFIVSQYMTSIYLRCMSRFEECEWIALPSLDRKFILPDSLWSFLTSVCLMLPASPGLIFLEKSIYEQLSDAGRLNTDAVNAILHQSVHLHFVEPPTEV